MIKGFFEYKDENGLRTSQRVAEFSKIEELDDSEGTRVHFLDDQNDSCEIETSEKYDDIVKRVAEFEPIISFSDTDTEDDEEAS